MKLLKTETSQIFHTGEIDFSSVSFSFTTPLMIITFFFVGITLLLLIPAWLLSEGKENPKTCLSCFGIIALTITLILGFIAIGKSADAMNADKQAIADALMKTENAKMKHHLMQDYNAKIEGNSFKYTDKKIKLKDKEFTLLLKNGSSVKASLEISKDGEKVTAFVTSQEVPLKLQPIN